MRIVKSPNISFKNMIKISIKDKFMGGGRIETPMNKIFKIAEEHDAPLFIGEDVFILSSSDGIKKDLSENKIIFQEVKDEIEN